MRQESGGEAFSIICIDAALESDTEKEASVHSRVMQSNCPWLNVQNGR